MMEFFNRKRSAEQVRRVEPTLDIASSKEIAAMKMGQDVKNSSSMTGNFNADEFGQFIRGGMASGTGMVVNEKTAMKVSAVYSCVSLIGGSVASLPLPVYKDNDKGRERDNKHQMQALLNRRPNPNYSAAVFWESIIGSLLLNGDGFARIIRPGRLSAKIIGLDWYPSKEVEVKDDNGQIIYILKRNGRTEAVLPDDMIHIPGPGFDGLRGMSQIKFVLSNAAGVALAADEYSASFFKNGARPDFAIEVPGNPGKEQRDLFRQEWSERYSGMGNNHLPAILAGGAKVHEVTMNAEDAQLITTRQFQVEDIARIFGVPPHMIGHTSKASSFGTGIEQMSIGYVKYTLNRHLVKIEQELNTKCFTGDKQHFVEFNTAGLERGDYKTRMEGYRIAVGRAGEPGWMLPEEIRRLENLSPEGDDKLNTGMTNESTAQTTGA